MKEFNRVLVISDMHIPYMHPDLTPFLKKLVELINPDKVVCIGDEVDKHAMSFHPSDPDLMSAGDELNKSIAILNGLYEFIPECDVVDSNHGSMVYRKGKHHGIPRKYLKSYNEILEAPSGWKWHHDLVLKVTGGQEVYFHHGKSANILSVSQNMGMCCVQGHYHSKFSIGYWANPTALYWAMQVGCLIDDESLAFHYNKVTKDRPIIGMGAIINGMPQLIPMILNNEGRWIGRFHF